MATSRHITCGGYDLEDVRWENYVLTGKSRIVADDPYILYVTEPAGFSLKKASFNGKEIREIERKGSLAQISFLPAESMTLKWKLEYKKNPDLFVPIDNRQEDVRGIIAGMINFLLGWDVFCFHLVVASR